MSLPTRYTLTRTLPLGRRIGTLAALHAALSLAWLAVGLTLFAIRWDNPAAGPLVVPAGLSIVVCAIVQGRLAWTAIRSGKLAPARDPLVRFAYWRRLAIGAVLVYLAALAVGPYPYLGAAWLAALGVWQTLLLLPLAASPQALESWRSWTDRHTARRLSWLVVSLVVALVAVEGVLQLCRLAGQGRWFARAAHALAGADDAGSLDVARLGPARFRVAVLSGQPRSRQRDGYLAHIEQSVPGLEIVPLDAPLASADADEAQIADQVAAAQADLVLAVLPVCHDLSREASCGGYFDWRRFELPALFVGRPVADEAVALPRHAADHESFLHGLSPQLAACRTPIDGAMRERWERVFGSLDRVIAVCREADVPLALVIVPAEFQVNQALLGTLLRRYGVSSGQVDVDLPQRRLAGFAHERQLPLIDLLPHLRLCRESAFVRHASTLNAAGNSAAATAIGGWLQSRYAGQIAAQLSKTP
jgi:hypothetical protein